MRRRETGALGEALAVRYLERCGHTVLERNYRCREGEIDIITRKDDCLVFIEVRTKRSSMFGTPEESITETKKQHLRAVAERYRESHPGLPESWRIDVVAIELERNGNVKRLDVIENAIEGE